MAQVTRAEGQFLKEPRDVGSTHRQLCMCLTNAPSVSKGVSLSIGIAQKQANKMGVNNQTFSDPLTHSSPRPDRREEKTGGKDQKKRREQHRSPLLVAELLALFIAVASFQAHIIQSNLPGVTTPLFTFEDDLGRERTHWSSLLCPSPGMLIQQNEGELPPVLNSELNRRKDQRTVSPEACILVETEIPRKLFIRPRYSEPVAL